MQQGSSLSKHNLSAAAKYLLIFPAQCLHLVQSTAGTRLTAAIAVEEYFKLPAEDFDTCNPIHWWMG